MARHHKSHKSKRHHSSAMGHHSYSDGIEDGRHGGRSMYEPSERKMEQRSGEMISEDHNAIANMPQHVVYKPYTHGHMYLNTHLDDTMSGIDHQQHEDIGIANRHKAKSMY